jgi:hypothetical protein
MTDACTDETLTLSCKEGLVYLVTSPLVLHVKIGMWTSNHKKLLDRYRTYYGSDTNLYIYETKTPRLHESIFKEKFLDFHICLELYQKEYIEEYKIYLKKLCDTKEIFMTSNSPQKVSTKQKLLYLVNLLNIDIDSNECIIPKSKIQENIMEINTKINIILSSLDIEYVEDSQFETVIDKFNKVLQIWYKKCIIDSDDENNLEIIPYDKKKVPNDEELYEKCSDNHILQTRFPEIVPENIPKLSELINDNDEPLIRLEILENLYDERYMNIDNYLENEDKRPGYVAAIRELCKLLGLQSTVDTEAKITEAKLYHKIGDRDIVKEKLSKLAIIMKFRKTPLDSTKQRRWCLKKILENFSGIDLVYGQDSKKTDGIRLSCQYIHINDPFVKDVLSILI